MFFSSPYTFSNPLSPSPSKLGRQLRWVACLLVCVQSLYVSLFETEEKGYVPARLSLAWQIKSLASLAFILKPIIPHFVNFQKLCQPTTIFRSFWVTCSSCALEYNRIAIKQTLTYVYLLIGFFFYLKKLKI
jgi:hypothetical protein